MKKISALVLAFMIIISINSSVSADKFSDISAEHYCFEAAIYLKKAGILSGYPDGSFAPEQGVTRAEMAAIVCRMAGAAPSDNKQIFDDVPSEHWAAAYIARAAEDKIISGDGNGIYRPSDSVKYEEAVKMTLSAAGLAGNITPNPADWSAAYLAIAEAVNITDSLKGQKGTDASRADIAVMVYNAIRASRDKEIMAYANTLYNKENKIHTDVSFAVDTDIFLKDNTAFNRELAKASCALAMTSYSYIYPEGSSGTDGILQGIGFEDIKKYNLKDIYTDNHTTSITAGHRLIGAPGSEAELISLTIRGTDGSVKEWTSNFDIGSGEISNPDHTVSENHEGYDIAATRVLKLLDEYIAANTSPEAKKIIWITGHSRGGSIANICASRLEDYTCYAYTFGASNSTTNQNADKYGYIFNIVNKDDLVTYIPMTEWGFNVYGKSAGISVADTLSEKWIAKTGLKKYKFYNGSVAEVSSLMASCSADRKGCYTYRDDGKIYIGLESEAEGAEVTAALNESYAKESLNYCTFEVTKAPEGVEYPYMLEINMQPAFLMQNIAAVMAGDVSAIEFVTMILPEYLENTRTAVVASYLGGLKHPHLTETYYVITENIQESDFN